MKKLYLFDFDGTLTYKDTMFLFLQFYDPAKYRIHFLRHIPLFVLLKCGLADATKVKKSFIASILKGQSKEKLEEVAQLFFEHNYPSLLRENALDFIANINKSMTDSFIVSASLDIWVKPFAEKFGMTLLCTEAAYNNGIFTGEFSTPNCNGNEKVNRIKSAILGRKFDKKIAFGDSSGDRAMLNFANEGHFRFFH